MLDDLIISPRLTIPAEELQERFIRASGPGGQNVNKVSTAVELRFDLAHSPSVPEDIRERALKRGGHRLTEDGLVIIKAQQFRTQERNREDARAQLVAFFSAVLEPPKLRRPTKPSRAAKAKRVDSKVARAKIKATRGRFRDDE